MVSSSIVSASVSSCSVLSTKPVKHFEPSEIALRPESCSFKSNCDNFLLSRLPKDVISQSQLSQEVKNTFAECSFCALPRRSSWPHPDSSTSFSKQSFVAWTLERKRGDDVRRGDILIQRAVVGLDGKWKTSLSYEEVVTLQAQEEESRLFRYGPPPGDVAELEAFCRIYRLAEELHVAVMNSLRDLNLQQTETVEQNGAVVCNGDVSPMSEERGDVPEAEEMVVAGLAQIGAILHECRRSVLEGSSHMGTNRLDANAKNEDSLPPLAMMRSQLKDACLQLQNALEAVLPSDEGLTLTVKRSLERLKNVCLDAGFPRLLGSPSHADIPNFSAVRLKPFRAGRELDPNEEIAFWRGGQVTEEGLAWLLENGFKTVVDMRGDDVGNQWIEPVAKELETGSPRIKYVRLPVSFGNTPSSEQVEIFAMLVADKANQPLYLHSQGGVGRACGMVLRWREFTLRGSLEIDNKSVVIDSEGNPKLVSNNTNSAIASVKGLEGNVEVNLRAEKSGVLDKGGETVIAADGDSVVYLNGSVEIGEESGELLEESLSPVLSAREIERFARTGSEFDEFEIGTQGSLLVKEFENGSGSTSDEEEREEEGDSTENNSAVSAGAIIAVVPNPFAAQIPKSNVLSKKTMSEFFRTKKVGKNSLLESSRQQLLRKSTQSQQNRKNIKPREDVEEGTITGPAGRWGIAEPGIPRAGSGSESSSSSYSKDEDERNTDDDEDLEISRIGWIPHENESTVGDVSEERESNGTTVDRAVQVQGNASTGSEGGSHDQGGGGGGGEEAGIGNSVDGKQPTQKAANGALFRVTDQPPERNGSIKNSTNGAMKQQEEVEEVAFIDGDMCASTTGVVRLQSRRKAEMYLVRTDGFSCTRERVKESTLAFTHPSTQQQMLMWKTPPKTCLLLKKLGDELMDEAQQVATWLYHQEGINVVVEPELHDRFARIPGFGFVQTYYNQDTSKLHERVDFVVCLGGDGVILHASNLFRSAVPPVVSFNLGSLGFLTAHPFEDFKLDLRAIIHGNSTMDGVYITLRMRLRCELFRNGKPMPGKVFDVLNEIVVDRGSNPYLCKIECYERNRLITKVQADGVMVATPTGSTAYSTAAGGSMVHPNVPCMLFTPICPHTLSFRPVILPDSALLELKVPNDARNNAWVSFDGKKRQQLSKGDSVRICMSEHPMPTVNKSDQTDDWFRSLVRCLSWNERLEQKALIVSP